MLSLLAKRLGRHSRRTTGRRAAPVLHAALGPARSSVGESLRHSVGAAAGLDSLIAKGGAARFLHAGVSKTVPLDGHRRPMQSAAALESGFRIGGACVSGLGKKNGAYLGAAYLGGGRSLGVGRIGVVGRQFWTSGGMRAAVSDVSDVGLDGAKSSFAADVGFSVWNEDNLLTREDTLQVGMLLSSIYAHSGVRLAVCAINDYRGLPTTANDQLRAFTERFHVNRFPDVEERKHTGVLLYFHKQRNVQMRVGGKIHDHLPPNVCAEIQLSHMFPPLKEGRIGDGLRAGLKQIAGRLPALAKPGSSKPDATTPSGMARESSSESDATTPSESSQTSSSSNPKPVKKTSWWQDFKGWNRAMLRGERPTGVTAIYGASVGVGVYYLWQGLKWLFWIGTGAFIAWRVWKWLKTHGYLPPSEAEKQKMVEQAEAAETKRQAEKKRHEEEQESTRKKQEESRRPLPEANAKKGPSGGSGGGGGGNNTSGGTANNTSGGKAGGQDDKHNKQDEDDKTAFVGTAAFAAATAGKKMSDDEANSKASTEEAERVRARREERERRDAEAQADRAEERAFHAARLGRIREEEHAARIRESGYWIIRNAATEQPTYSPSPPKPEIHGAVKAAAKGAVAAVAYKEVRNDYDKYRTEQRAKEARIAVQLEQEAVRSRSRSSSSGGSIYGSGSASNSGSSSNDGGSSSGLSILGAIFSGGGGGGDGGSSSGGSF
jgi:uncharacterized membrane protein YgcG